MARPVCILADGIGYSAPNYGSIEFDKWAWKISNTILTRHGSIKDQYLVLLETAFAYDSVNWKCPISYEGKCTMENSGTSPSQWPIIKESQLVPDVHCTLPWFCGCTFSDLQPVDYHRLHHPSDAGSLQQMSWYAKIKQQKSKDHWADFFSLLWPVTL